MKEILFNQEGTFEAYYAATKWASDNGYSYGSMCAPLPIALMKGEYHIAKWKNLTVKERKAVDGIITGSSFREGPLKIVIFK